MNGPEIERLLTLIDQNIAENGAAMNDEFFRYLDDHRAEALEQLRATGVVSVQTSLGNMRVSLQELQHAAV